MDFDDLILLPVSLLRDDRELRERAQLSGFVAHNVEALLCLKPEAERRQWFADLLASPWPNPVVVPVTVFQADVPEQDPRVCDLELFRLPYPDNRPATPGPLRYDMER